MLLFYFCLLQEQLLDPIVFIDQLLLQKVHILQPGIFGLDVALKLLADHFLRLKLLLELDFLVLELLLL